MSNEQRVTQITKWWASREGEPALELAGSGQKYFWRREIKARLTGMQRTRVPGVCLPSR